MITFWIALIISSFVFGEFDGWTDYIVVVVGAMYTTMYLSNYVNQYLTIDEVSIKLNSIFSEKILLSEIKVFKKFAGEYILKTDNKVLRIDTSLIDEESLVDLNRVLENLKLS